MIAVRLKAMNSFDLMKIILKQANIKARRKINMTVDFKGIDIKE